VKRSLALGLAVALTAFAAAPAAAQSYGQYGGAVPIPSGSHLTGLYLNASENLFGFIGQLRLSFYPGVDFGFQGGLMRNTTGDGNRTTLRLGTDLKAQVAGGPSAVLDLALGGHLGAEIGDGYDILRLGPTLVASTDVPFGQNGAFIPYAGLGVTYSRLDADAGDTSDYSFPFRLGGEVRFVPELRFITELQFNLGADELLNDNFEVAAGVNLPF
jgi:hypothetical protein